MHFILTEKYSDNRDSRSDNICVSSDKFGFFCLFAIFSLFESCALFGDENENIRYTNCPMSTHPVEKIALACYACLCFMKDARSLPKCADVLYSILLSFHCFLKLWLISWSTHFPVSVLQSFNWVSAAFALYRVCPFEFAPRLSNVQMSWFVMKIAKERRLSQNVLNRDFKIVDDGRLRRLNECHTTFHTFEMSPPELCTANAMYLHL